MSIEFKYPLQDCTSCPLSGKFGYGYEGDIEKADIIILGEAPGFEEEKTGLPFQGKAGQLLRKFLKKHNFPFERAVITNPVLCRPPENKINLTMVKACKNNMYAMMTAVQPKYIILTGNIPMQALLGKKGITKHRGSTIEMNGADVFPIFHPSYVNRKAGDKDIEKMFDKDIEFICGKINGTHEEVVKELNYIMVDSMDEFHKMIGHIHKTKKVAIDIETTGNRHWLNKIRSIQFSPEEKWAYYVPILEHDYNCKNLDFIEVEDVDKNGKPRMTTLFPYWGKPDEEIIWTTVKVLLEHPGLLKTGQNFKFDMKFLLHYLYPKDYDRAVESFAFDTIFAFYLHNENSPNDLKTNSYLHFPDLRGYAQEVQSKMSDTDEEENDWTKVKIESLAPYGCGDADATLRLANLYTYNFFKTEEHADSMLQYFYNFYMPLSKILTKAERVGIGIDIPRMEKVKKKYEIEKQQIEDEVLAMAGRETDAIVRDRILAIKPTLSEARLAALVKKDKLNLNSAQQLGKLLFEEMGLPVIKKTDTGQPSTDKEVMKTLAINYPFCRKLVKYKNRMKMISTYFNGAVKELEPEGTIVPGFPMLHFTCNLIGTVTGRTSYKKYPIQTIPREVDVRSIICAPPGYYLVEWDLSQIELRLAAWYSQDPIMMDEYKNSVDIHNETLKFMTRMTDKQLKELKKDKPDEFKELRKKAKGYNFGGLYGGCFKRNSLIMTTKGLKLIQDVKEGESIMNHLGQFQVAKLHKNGFKETYKVELDNGLSFNCTTNHSIHTPLGFKQLHLLHPESPVVCLYNTQCFSNEYIETKEVPSNLRYQKVTEWRRPKIVSERLGSYIGFWLAEGSVSKPNPPRRNYFHKLKITQGLTNKSDAAWDYISNLTKELFCEENVGLIETKQRNVVVSQVGLCEWFMDLIGRDNLDSYTKYIPEVIKESPKTVQTEMLRALFEGDGWISKRGVVGYKSKSLRLIQDIQLMLLNLGIICRIRYEKSNSYRLVINGCSTEDYLREIGFITKLDSRIFKLRDHDNSTTGTYVIDNKHFLSRIKSIKLEGSHEVFDLTVKNEPYYSVSFVSVHNSADTLSSKLNEKLEEGEAIVTEAEAQAHIDYFFGKYQGLKTYHDVIIQSAIEKGYVKSCFGRVRRLPVLSMPPQEDMKREISEAKRQALNSIIQSTASDITKFAMIELYNWITKHGKASILSFDVHDAMLALVKEEELKDVLLMGKHFMEQERKPIMKDQMLILAEAEVYRNWKINISEEELKSAGLTKKDLE